MDRLLSARVSASGAHVDAIGLVYSSRLMETAMLGRQDGIGKHFWGPSQHVSRVSKLDDSRLAYHRKSSGCSKRYRFRCSLRKTVSPRSSFECSEAALDTKAAISSPSMRMRMPNRDHFATKHRARRGISICLSACLHVHNHGDTVIDPAQLILTRRPLGQFVWNSKRRC